MTPRNLPTLPPDMSARTAFGRKTTVLVAAIGLIVLALTVAFPHAVPSAVSTVVAVLYLVSAFDRNWLLTRGLKSPAVVQIGDEQARAIPDAELPTYTVLLPAYQEPAIVANLINGVGQIDYPADKLEVLLLLEEDDTETIDAVAELSMNSIRTIIVPDSQPKTKPKACNYGMAQPGTRGDYVTIYDAEDIPDPLQLRRAAMAFRQAPGDVGCLQAKLGYFNERQNLLTRLFALEYAQWFGVVLPAVVRANCVVPLGGTSNHLPTRVWHEVGGWDEYNVTEDADLGVRLARHGYRTQILDSVTLEEANSDVVNWIRQRSRWYKGYLQTNLVHLRHPLVLRREIGTKAVLRLINMTGAVPVTNIINLAFWVLMVTWFVGRLAIVEVLFPPLPYYLYQLLFMVGAPLAIFVGLVVTAAIGRPHLWWAALAVPAYWILQSVAAVKAVYQLVFRPFYWEKTVHGLTDAVAPASSTRTTS